MPDEHWDDILLSAEEIEALKTSLPAPPQTPGGFKDLGTTPLAQQLGLSDEQLNGHWCSRCRGIWFGYTLETQCPVCGNRRG